MEKIFRVVDLRGKEVTPLYFDAMTIRFYQHREINPKLDGTRTYKTGNVTVILEDVNSVRGQCMVKIEGDESDIERKITQIEKVSGFKLEVKN